MLQTIPTCVRKGRGLVGRVWESMYTHTDTHTDGKVFLSLSNRVGLLLPFCSVALQMSINRLQLWFWLIVLDADVWKQTRRWKSKVDFEMTRTYKWAEEPLVAFAQRLPPSSVPDTPNRIPATPPQTCLGLEGWGEGGEGSEGFPRGLYSLVTAKRLPLPEGCHGNAIWFLQQCQSTTSLPILLLISWATLNTHTCAHTHTCTRALCDWTIMLEIMTQSPLWGLIMPTRIKSWFFWK